MLGFPLRAGCDALVARSVVRRRPLARVARIRPRALPAGPSTPETDAHVCPMFTTKGLPIRLWPRASVETFPGSLLMTIKAPNTQTFKSGIFPTLELRNQHTHNTRADFIAVLYICIVSCDVFENRIDDLAILRLVHNDRHTIPKHPQQHPNSNEMWRGDHAHSNACRLGISLGCLLKLVKCLRVPELGLVATLVTL